MTRVFSTTRQIYVYFQASKQPDASEPATSAKPENQPLFAFVTLSSAGSKVFETPPMAIVPNAASRLGTMPLTFSLGVNGLPAGQYGCQVTVLDPAMRKSNFWRAPIMLTQ
jgi:hypothetical protein